MTIQTRLQEKRQKELMDKSKNPAGAEHMEESASTNRPGVADNTQGREEDVVIYDRNPNPPRPAALSGADYQSIADRVNEANHEMMLNMMTQVAAVMRPMLEDNRNSSVQVQTSVEASMNQLRQELGRNQQQINQSIDRLVHAVETFAGPARGEAQGQQQPAYGHVQLMRRFEQNAGNQPPPGMPPYQNPPYAPAPPPNQAPQIPPVQHLQAAPAAQPPPYQPQAPQQPQYPPNPPPYQAPYQPLKCNQVHNQQCNHRHMCRRSDSRPSMPNNPPLQANAGQPQQQAWQPQAYNQGPYNPYPQNPHQPAVVTP